MRPARFPEELDARITLLPMRRTMFNALTGLLVALAGCSQRSVYIPLSQNVALFDSSRAFQAQTYISANHLELQGAATLSKRLVVATNLNYGAGITAYDAAVGWYGHPQNARLLWSVLGGGGYTSNIIYPGDHDRLVLREAGVDYDVQARYQRYYVQPAAGFTGTMRAYQIRYYFALSAKASLLHFNNFIYRKIDRVLTTQSGYPVYLLSRNYANAAVITLEPCITNRVERHGLSGILQLQAIIPYSADVDLRHIKFSPGLLFSAGVGYTFLLRKKVPETYQEYE